MDASTKELADGFLSLIGGMHSGLDPLLLTAESGRYAVGVNVTAREGIIQTRPAFKEFATLPNGKFQGLGVWKLESCDRAVFVVDGVLYSMRLDTKETVPHGLLFSPTVERCYFVQAYKWMVIQDGTSHPKALQEDENGVAEVYSESASYEDADSPPADLCLTPGFVSAYAHGRLHYVPTKLPALAPVVDDESDPDQLNATPDILESESGKASFVSTDILDIYRPQFLFRMTEHRVLNEGGAIELPSELGVINGMSTFRNAATGTGTGALVVFAREGVCAFDVSISRGEWKKVNIGQVLFSTIGTRSPFGLVQMNSDIGFIDTEGRLRSVSFEKGNVGNTLTSLPLSHELDIFHKQDDLSNLTLASSNFNDSRLTFTMMSEDKNGTPCFKALGSLDFARLYSMSGAEGAAFDGVWTGFHFMHTFTARNAERVPLHMAAVRTESGGNKLLALDQDGSEVKDAGGAGVESMIVTRFMDFQAPVDTKALKHVELWLSGIACDSSLAVYFRPRGVSGWTLAGSKTFNVPDGSEPQSRRRVNLPITVEEIGCDPVTGDKLNVATQVQFAIVWTGRLKLDRFRVIAGLRTDENTACDAEDNPDNNTYAGSGVELDYLRYSAGI